MELFKKLSELVTPPTTTSKMPSGVKPEWREPEASLASLVKPLLKQLLTASSIEDPMAKQSVAEMKQIARTGGLYLAAFEMKAQLDLTPLVDGVGAQNHKARGYVLAADFILGHIHRELDAARAGLRPIGPNVFRGYCNEMIACLLEGGNIRRAVEVPIILFDDLLITAVDNLERGSSYLALAEQALASTFQLTKQWWAQQIERATETLKPKTRIDRFTSDPGPPFSSIDSHVIDYVDALRQKAEKIKVGVAAYENRAESRESSAQETRAQLNRLHRGLKIADSAQYAAFSAQLKERIAGLLQAVQAERSLELFRRAAEDYETQGDEENALYFTKLSAARYKKAHACFMKVGSTKDAARVLSKLGKPLPD